MAPDPRISNHDRDAIAPPDGAGPQRYSRTSWILFGLLVASIVLTPIGVMVCAKIREHEVWAGWLAFEGYARLDQAIHHHGGDLDWKDDGSLALPWAEAVRHVELDKNRIVIEYGYWFHLYGIEHFSSKQLADDQSRDNPEMVRVNELTLFYDETPESNDKLSP